MKFIMILFTTLFFILGCCDEDNIPEQTNINCTEFKKNFIDYDEEAIRVIIDSLCQKYSPIPTQDDELGHKENTIRLMEELNRNCTDFHFSFECYACLESLPPQTKIKLEIDSLGVGIVRLFSLRVPESRVMYMN